MENAVDREKVIKGLEACGLKNIKCKDRGCPYIDSRQNYACFLELYADVLAMLKAQEPKQARIEGNDMIHVAYCPTCGKMLKPWGARYCYDCGQAVKWDD